MREIPDSVMLRVLEEIERSRPNSTIPHYPPFAAWGRVRGPGRAFDAWRKTLGLTSSVGLYVHVPFCRTVCSFCNVGPRRVFRPGDLKRYLDCLKVEAGLYSKVFSGVKFSALYVGGGTPNVLEPDQIRNLFAILGDNFNFVRGSQRVCEAIPDFLDERRLSALKDAQITCLAVGVQSLDDAVIRSSGRAQDNSLVKERFRLARRFGIPRLLVDLIVGLPGQSEGSFLGDVRTVASWRPDDIYLGEFNPVNTLFEKSGGRISDVDRRSCALSVGKALSVLRRMGYHHRGEEAYATLDPRSQDWRGFHPFFTSDSLLGLGLGAVSHAWGSLRYSNVSDWERYVRILGSGRLPLANGCALTAKKEMIHFMLSSLDRGWVSRREFQEEFGEDIEKCFGSELEDLLSRGTLKRTRLHYRVIDSEHAEYAICGAFFERSVVDRIYGRAAKGEGG